MPTQEHPKPVMLKKSIVVIALLILIPPCVVIGYNVMQSTRQNQNDKIVSESTSQNMASDSDTAWFQEQTVKKTLSLKQVPLEVVPNHDVTVVPTPAASVASVSPMVNSQELHEAMSASITSNQLIGIPPAAEQTSSPTTSTQSGIRGSENDQSEQSEKKAFVQMNGIAQNNILGASVENPITPYELQAGAIIPAILITGINSDLPGQITAQVRSNVYDSISGKYLVIPQGAKLTGLYDSQIAYGQERVLVVWKRVIFPNGQSIDLEGMPGIDLSGYGGFSDLVNNHYGKIAGSVLLMTVLGAGAQLSQPQNNDNNTNSNPTVSQTIAQSMGTNVINTATMLTNKNINLQPTLEIQPGYEFNVSVTKDMVFPAPYK